MVGGKTSVEEESSFNRVEFGALNKRLSKLLEKISMFPEEP